MSDAGQPYRGDYLRPAFANATVADVMTPGIIACAPDTPLETVAELMATHRVHAVAVGGITANVPLRAVATLVRAGEETVVAREAAGLLEVRGGCDVRGDGFLASVA